MRPKSVLGCRRESPLERDKDNKFLGEEVFPVMEESLLLRQIPHSVEAEQSVLGAMLIDAPVHPRCH